MKHPFSRAFLALSLAGLGLVSGAAAAPLKVASLSTVLSDVARNVGGDKVQVEEIVKGGVDPHEFQPSPGDVELVAGADVVLVSGKGMEGYLSKLEESGDQKKFINVGDGIGSSLKLKDEGKTIEDPHWWHSVANVKKAADVIRNALIAADPADKDAFTANDATYQGKLDDLDNAIKLKVAELGRDKRKLVTSHDAFSIFRAGLRVQNLSHRRRQHRRGAQHAQGRRTARDHQKGKSEGRVFREYAEPEGHHADHEGNGGQGRWRTVCRWLGRARDSDAATYDAMMRHNVNTIVDALK